MGEYAEHDGERIKIGTCEDMYYLRADQAERVRALEGNVDPLRDAAGIRFRFPFPDEDSIQPGAFEAYGRSLPVDVEEIPSGFDHYSVQFTASAGYLTSLPCPEGPDAPKGLVIHRNGFAGRTKISQQRVWDGMLVLVAECGGCGAKYRLETLELAEPYVVACRARADRLEHAATIDPRRPSSTTPHAWDSSITYWHTIADRILAGYTNPPAWVRETSQVPA